MTPSAGGGLNVEGGTMLLKDKVAIVTGGARGIGRGIALEFAERGGSVVVVDILAAEAEQTVAELRRAGGKGIFVGCNITDGAQVGNVLEKTMAEYGTVDILVNNAGGEPSSMPAAELPESQWDKVIAINLKGAFLFCQAVIPVMKKHGSGKIISISSLGAFHSPHPSVAYHSAKLGMLGMTLDLASELAPHNIHVNAILPGAIRTECLDSFIQSEDKDGFYAEICREIPLGRMGTPRDIARVCVFLASQLSDYMTGSILAVAGGQPFVGIQSAQEGFFTQH